MKWTPEHIDFLARNSKIMPPELIAERLGREVEHVNSQITRQGLTTYRQHQIDLTELEVVQLIKDGMSANDIIEKTQVSITAYKRIMSQIDFREKNVIEYVQRENYFDRGEQDIWDSLDENRYSFDELSEEEKEIYEDPAYAWNQFFNLEIETELELVENKNVA